MKELKKLIEATSVLSTTDMISIKGGVRDTRSTQTTTPSTTVGGPVAKR